MYVHRITGKTKVTFCDILANKYFGPYQHFCIYGFTIWEVFLCEHWEARSRQQVVLLVL